MSIPLAPGEHPPLDGAEKVRVLDDGTPHHHSARTKARKAALDILFEAEVRQLDPLVLLSERDPREFTVQLVQGVAAHLDELDQRIAECASLDWLPERMPLLDISLARLAMWELDFTDAAAAVTIAEAVGLADEYSTDASANFLNGLLGRAARSRPEQVGGPSV